MTCLTKNQRQVQLIAECLQHQSEASHGTRVNMGCGAGDNINGDRTIQIKASHEILGPLGWFYKHNAMHAGSIPIECDEWGRCARCVTLGFFRCDA